MTTATATSPWMTTDEVAADARMSAEWVARQCANGALKATKAGRMWRIRRDDYIRFMGGGKLPVTRPARESMRRKAK